MTRTATALLLSILLAACGRSHGDDVDSGRDSSVDTGGDSTPPIVCDAGPIPTCARGVCCDETAPAGGPCGNVCPAGFSPLCEPDPAAICAPGLRDCAQPSDCVLADMQCCGPCVRTLDNTTSVRRDRLVDYFDEGTECAAVDCAACPPPEPTDSRVAATCEANVCEVIAIRPTALTACTDDSDCRVRALECCECGADVNTYNLTGVRVDAEGALTELLCDTGATCDDCVPDYGPHVTACVDDGHCALIVGGL